MGDSIMWQSCGGPSEAVPSIAPTMLQMRDGGCFGWSGATTAEMLYMLNGGSFVSGGDGQPDAQYDLRQRMDAASVLVVGLGTNDGTRDPTGQTPSPWPIKTGPGGVLTQVPPESFRADIDRLVALSAGKPIYWYTISSEPGDGDYNREIYAAAQRYPQLHVLPWHQKVIDHPHYVYDGIHVTDAGRAARWELARDAILGSEYPTVREYVERMIPVVFGRPATGWESDLRISQLQNTRPRLNMMGEFTDSVEYKLHRAKLLYRSLLGREPSSAEIDQDYQSFSAGASVQSVELRLQGNDERYFGRTGGSDQSWAMETYKFYFPDTPSPQVINRWVGAAQAEGRSSAAGQMLAEQAASKMRVNDVYMEVLSRPASDAELEAWAPFVASTRGSADLMVALLSSDEF